jgi:SPP1 family predicted phage head-tail adaptor
MTLTNAELDRLRADIADLLPDTCVISGVSYASDGAGEWIPTWAAAGTVDCRVDPSNGIETLAGGAIQSFHRYTLTLPYDAPITTANRVIIGGTTYNVISVTAGDSWKLDTRAQIEKL